ncbi:restriction endonuclease subunit S [Pseudoalteromonas sp. Cn5-37]|uniref:restriction endonuclease subunit S n=1 Tax=Pseudoalteromonas sp. Cn5-37 TaxID=2908886 RepID=UPI001F333FBF|nr:restriction endonuclease subunit S [Pseudoalteromonas sp. Cn5-37]MCF2918272.1 restriction endonuclease subunit S [Pseudoalteromonas sp. Cn5-37]
MVPNGWEVKKFGDLFNVKSGFGFKHSEYADSGTPLIKIDNVSHGYVKWNNVSYLPDSYREDYSDILLKEGDLLLALNRPITQGKLKLVKLTKSDVPSILYQRVGRIDFKTNDLEKDFYLYLLDTAIYRFVSHKAIGSDQPFISTTELKKLNIVKPPLPEQRKISKILSTWDKAISTTERLIDNSTQQKKALMQQLLTGAHTQRKRLLDDSGKPFEGEWEEKRLSELGDIYSGGTPSTAKPEYWDGDINWVTPTDITKQDSIYIESTARLVSMDGIKNSSAKLLPKGTLLVCTRATIGEMAIASHEMSTNQGFKNIVPNENTNIEFVYYLLNFYKHKLISKASGSTFLELSKSAFEGLYFYVPEYQEQKKIAAVLLNADREIDALQQQLADLKQEKKALMQQLLTGKKRVLI